MRLDQLMTNLITNAIRYSKPGGTVKVLISAKGNEATFKGHREAQPLSAKIKEMIPTKMFIKINGDPTNKDSYGLGLYIVKAIVDWQKGKRKVTSTEKKEFLSVLFFLNNYNFNCVLNLPTLNGLNNYFLFLKIKSRRNYNFTLLISQ